MGKVDERPTCPRCGSSSVSPAVGSGVCSRCLIGLALADEADAVDATIGPYAILDVLGEGGMGVVYLAEQTAPIRRRVALKLIKLGMDTRDVLARFEGERQALALMSHPGIAQVHDAGATPEGRPYFVMEHVPGAHITDYCDRQRLGIGDRLSLFLQVCEAIQHAHQRGVLHRDIKPSNVLVGEDGLPPRVKVIDFGVAKAIGGRDPLSAFSTHAGTVLGTPAYMSPEQAASEGRDVDTRTDVYQLGVLLYELLCGESPLPVADLQGLTLDELRWRIVALDPPRPSALRAGLRRELDWIVLKALEKERGRRYASPSELAADIQRYLRHEPVVAGPPGVLYRARKFCRRHRLGVAVAAAAAVVLASFAAAMTVQARRVVRERDRANLEAAASRQVSEFLIDLFEVSDPGEARGGTIAAREILDRGARRIEDELAAQPELQARLMGTIGVVYKKLGLYSSAAPLLERSRAIHDSVLGEEHRDTLRAAMELGELLLAQGNAADAERMFRDVLNTARRSLPPDDSLTLTALSDLAVVCHVSGQLAEAETLYVEALAERRRVLGAEAAETLETLSNLAALIYAQGRFADAEPYMRDALEGRRRALGPDHPETLDSMMNLATALMTLRRLAEAEPHAREAVSVGRRVRPDHPKTFAAINNLGKLLELQGRLEEAEPPYREAWEAQRRVLGAEHADTLWTAGNLGDLYTRLGRLSAAEAILVPALEQVRRAVSREHLLTGYTLRKCGRLAAAQGRYADGETLLQEAEQVLASLVGPENSQTRAAVEDLVALYERWGRPAQAERAKARLQ